MKEEDEWDIAGGGGGGGESDGLYGGDPMPHGAQSSPDFPPPPHIPNLA